MKTTPRIIIVGIGLFVAHNLLLTLPSFRHRFASHSGQREANQIKAEKMWDQPADPAFPQTFVVGTSMAYRLDPKLLGPDFVNMSLAGESMFTALELVCRKTQPFERIIIETNVIMKPIDHEFVANISTPTNSHIRRWLPSQRTQYRPANFLVPQLISRVVNQIGPIFQSQATAATNQTSSFRKQVIESVIRENQEIPLPSEINAQIDALSTRVTKLLSDNVQVLFLEMPVEPSISESPRALAIRQALMLKFPPDQFDWIMPAPATTYPTTDGIHLNAAGASLFTKRIMRHLQYETD